MVREEAVYREGIAIHAVHGLELALEVRAPAVVGRDDRAHRRTGVADLAARALARDKPLALEDLARRRACRQLPAAVAPLDHRQELDRAPGGVVAAQFDQRVDDVLRRTIGRRIGLGRSILESLRTVVQVTLEPLVAGLAANAKVRAKFSDRLALSEVIGDELRLLVHR